MTPQEQHWREALAAFQHERSAPTLLTLFAATEAYLPFFAPSPLYSAAHITTIALEFLHTLFTQVSSDDPGVVLGACVRRSLTTPPGGYSDVEDHLRLLGAYRFDLTARLDFADALHALLAPCPFRLQVLLLTCVQFPQARQQIMQAPQITIVDRWFLRHILKYFSGDVLPMDTTVTFPVPQSETARLLFFLSLYKRAPEVFVLLFLFRSFPQFVQFLHLFGGTTLQVPTLDTLQTLCTTLTEGYTALERGEPVPDDQRFVQALLRDAPAVQGETTLAADVGSFFERSAQLLLQHYGTFFERLMRQTDFQNPASLLTTYDYLQKDVTLQTRFLTTLLQQEGMYSPPSPPAEGPLGADAALLATLLTRCTEPATAPTPSEPPLPAPSERPSTARRPARRLQRLPKRVSRG